VAGRAFTPSIWGRIESKIERRSAPVGADLENDFGLKQRDYEREIGEFVNGIETFPVREGARS
jgi:hypothetical protein